MSLCCKTFPKLALKTATMGFSKKLKFWNRKMNLDDWLTVHYSITLVDLQLDAQSCLFTHNSFIKILYMFRALPCSSSGLRHNCIYAASGIVTLCR